MIKPIKNYEAYFFSNEKKLYGLSEKSIDLIEVIDQDGDIVAINDFFTKGGAIFISVDEMESERIDDVDITNPVAHIYQQKGDKVTEIKELPEKPTRSRSHYDSKEFTITEIEYEKKKMNDVKNVTISSGIERFFMVDGFMHFEGKGLFFNVSDGRYNEVVTVRENGLYFWGINNTNIEYIASAGTLYK